MSLVINASGDPRVLVGDVRNLVRAIDPAVPLARIKTMDQLLGESVGRNRGSARCCLEFFPLLRFCFLPWVSTASWRIP